MNGGHVPDIAMPEDKYRRFPNTSSKLNGRIAPGPAD